MNRDPRTIGVIVGHDAPLLEASVPLRMFTLDHGGTRPHAFTVLAAGETPGWVRTSAGVRLDLPHEPSDLDSAGIVVVPGWRSPDAGPPAAEVLDVLRRAHRDGAIVVGLCLGTFVLARAGLLEGRRATTHWRYQHLLAERYPGVTVVPDALYVDEHDVLTSAGSAAGLDACLHLLRRTVGPAVAAAAARVLVVAPQRAGGQSQFVEHPVPPVPGDDPVGEGVRHALAHLHETRLGVDDLARAAHRSRRSFDRDFRAVHGASPLQWIIHQRILRAQQLLADTDLPIDAVAQACGFTNGVALRPLFRRRVGVPPQTYRAAFRTR